MTDTSSASAVPSVAVGLPGTECSNYVTEVTPLNGADPLDIPSQQSSSTGNSLEERPDGWRLQMLDSVIADIQKAEFVAIDLEFSGLFKHPASTRHHILQKYFEDCVNSVGDFMAVQLGVCAAWRSSNDPDYHARTGNKGHPDVWCMAPYNFHIYPANRRIFTADSSTLVWLFDNGFSFRDWIKTGFNYARLALLQNLAAYRPAKFAASYRQVSVEGLQRVISALIEHEKPIVLHNGLFDMLHLHDKFIDAVPTSVGEFCSEWLRIFSGGVFDTKYIATSGKYSVLNLAAGGGTVLGTLYHHLYKLSACRTHICLAPRYYAHNTERNEPNAAESTTSSAFLRSITESYFLKPVPIGHVGSKCHEAGYDALVTAQVFLMENELFHAAQSKEQNPTQQHPLIPYNWKDSAQFGSLFKNVIEIMKVAPGNMNLEELAQNYQKSLRLLPKHPTTESPPSAPTLEQPESPSHPPKKRSRRTLEASSDATTTTLVPVTPVFNTFPESPGATPSEVASTDSAQQKLDETLDSSSSSQSQSQSPSQSVNQIHSNAAIAVSASSVSWAAPADAQDEETTPAENFENGGNIVLKSQMASSFEAGCSKASRLRSLLTRLQDQRTRVANATTGTVIPDTPVVPAASTPEAAKLSLATAKPQLPCASHPQPSFQEKIWRNQATTTSVHRSPQIFPLGDPYSSESISSRPIASCPQPNLLTSSSHSRPTAPTRHRMPFPTSHPTHFSHSNLRLSNYPPLRPPSATWAVPLRNYMARPYNNFSVHHGTRPSKQVYFSNQQWIKPSQAQQPVYLSSGSHSHAPVHSMPSQRFLRPSIQVAADTETHSMNKET